MNLETLSIVVTVGAAVFAAFCVIFMRMLSGVGKQVEVLRMTTARLEAQMSRNGGHSMRDVVDRVEALTKMLTSQMERQQRQIENIGLALPFGAFSMDAGGNWYEINRSLTRLIGRTEEELSGRNWLSRISEGDRHRVTAELNAALQDRRDIDIDFTMSKADGAALIVGMRSKLEPAGHYSGNLWLNPTR